VSKLVQCIPNFSEGTRPEIVARIIEGITSVSGVKLLNYSSNQDHNRSVVTFIGEPQVVLEGAFEGISEAAKLIDMEHHSGGHPRMGATDVVPFVPVTGVSMEECVKLARQLGERVARELGIPVYLYEYAATTPTRKNLADVRRGEYEGLKESITTPARKPDFGPQALHPSAGAIAIGARNPLVAFNVNLNTADLSIAQKIARSIRGSSGGLVNVKAMGVMLEEQNLAQVSMNMTDFRSTPLHRVLEIIRMEAGRYGVGIAGTEIVGTVPRDALLDAAHYYLQLDGFGEKQILENNL
jgi:glutamate formiminotransferase / 5-formyltetrahydrofolate cyclo-ligase